MYYILNNRIVYYPLISWDIEGLPFSLRPFFLGVSVSTSILESVVDYNKYTSSDFGASRQPFFFFFIYQSREL